MELALTRRRQGVSANDLGGEISTPTGANRSSRIVTLASAQCRPERCPISDPVSKIYFLPTLESLRDELECFLACLRATLM